MTTPTNTARAFSELLGWLLQHAKTCMTTDDDYARMKNYGNVGRVINEALRTIPDTESREYIVDLVRRLQRALEPHVRGTADDGDTEFALAVCDEIDELRNSVHLSPAKRRANLRDDAWEFACRCKAQGMTDKQIARQWNDEHKAEIHNNQTLRMTALKGKNLRYDRQKRPATRKR